MALLIFPANPFNGEEYIGGNGVTYTYSTVPGVWSTIGGGGGAIIPTGTVAPFFQAAAPTGWVQVTTQNNKAVRIVSGAGGGTGGTIPFSTLFSPTSTYSGGITITSGQVGDASLSIGQLASHQHGCSNDSVIAATTQGGQVRTAGAGGVQTSAVGSNAAHTHTLAGAAAVGNFTSNFDLQYVDMLLAAKS
jgi:hypothetical protein